MQGYRFLLKDKEKKDKGERIEVQMSPAVSHLKWQNQENLI